MTWQLFLSAYLALATVGFLLRRRLAQTFAKYNRLVHGFFFIAVLYPLGLVVAFMTSPSLAIGWVNFFILLAGSAVYPVINLLAFRASKDVDAGLFTILHNLTPIVTITAASLLLHERLNDQQLLGAVIIITSAFLATLPRLARRSKSSSAGILLALASVALLGLAIVYERWMLTRMDFGAYLVFGWGAQTLWMTIIAWPERKKLHVLRKMKHFVPVFSYGLAYALKGLCFVAALKLSGNASAVGAFASFLAVLVVLAAYVALKERELLWLKLGAAAVGTVGLIILNTG